jgi:hypothetical protein
VRGKCSHTLRSIALFVLHYPYSTGPSVLPHVGWPGLPDPIESVATTVAVPRCRIPRVVEWIRDDHPAGANLNNLPISLKSPPSRHLVLVEIALVFLVFFIQGAWPVPDVNEAHYLGKVIHFWNPSFGEGDLFFDSADSHPVFDVTFGWLSLWLSPTALAWVGRVLTWWFLAWAWRRLSFAVLPRNWWSILTATLFVFLAENFHMAGEWIIGGVEAKGAAYVLVFLGIEALVRDRWNRAWLLLGVGTLFHVLAGGWAMVATAFAWMFLGARRPPLRAIWPGLLGGFLLALPSVIPSLQLTWGIDPDLVRLANEIYVFARLPHHLNPASFPSYFVLRFAALMLLWVFIRGATPEEHPVWRLHAFVAGAIAVSMAGVIVAFATSGRPDWFAALLRLYWFRLSDVAVPIGVALGGAAWLDRTRLTRPVLTRWITAGLVLLAVWHVGGYSVERLRADQTPRSCGVEPAQFDQWRAACDWIAKPENVPPNALFLTPRMARTFKWYTGHGEVVNRKDVPQDAASIVEWWRRLCDIYATGDPEPGDQWYSSLAYEGTERVRRLARKYKADYVLTDVEPKLDLPVVYKNDSFVVYRVQE